MMQVKDVLRKNGFRFEKKYGQNFLTDEKLLESLVEMTGVGRDDTVVEIGVGAGTLTSALARNVKKVIGFEIDRKLQPVLAETLNGKTNVDIIYKDVMKTPTAKIENIVGGRFSVVANLPYYITTPILMKFLEESDKVDIIAVTVQEEVADRMCAKAGSADYGALTLAIDVVGDAEKVMRIPRDMFYPVPNVDSAVVIIKLNRNKYDGVDLTAFRDVVRSAFSSRRKTLVNNLMQSFGIPRAKAEEIVSKVKGDTMVRGEILTTDEFVALSKLV